MQGPQYLAQHELARIAIVVVINIVIIITISINILTIVTIIIFISCIIVVVIGAGSIGSLDDMSFSPMGQQLSQQGSGLSVLSNDLPFLDADGAGRSSEASPSYLFCPLSVLPICAALPIICPSWLCCPLTCPSWMLMGLVDHQRKLLPLSCPAICPSYLCCPSCLCCPPFLPFHQRQAGTFGPCVSSGMCFVSASLSFVHGFYNVIYLKTCRSVCTLNSFLSELLVCKPMQQLTCGLGFPSRLSICLTTNYLRCTQNNKSSHCHACKQSEDPATCLDVYDA